jgi:hypothetical protein
MKIINIKIKNRASKIVKLCYALVFADGNEEGNWEIIEMEGMEGQLGL